VIGQHVDLCRTEFWAALGAGIVLVYGIRHALTRKWAWAAVNVGFLVALIGPVYAAVLVAALAVLVGAIHLANRLGRARGAALLLTLGAAGLFIAYKWPVDRAWRPAWRVWTMSPLVSIGFSYVFLRLIELLRAAGEKIHRLPDLPDAVNFLLPFHMLAAGPIQSYEDFVIQPAVASSLSAWEVLEASERIVRGLFKKLVLAAAIHTILLTHMQVEGWWFLVEMQVSFIWLYIDFSAYSDIAVGVGRLMGVATPENFNKPFLARNVTVFWERWHISLSTWIRRNVFTPMQMGAMRRTRGRYALAAASAAFVVSFTLCGLWHQVNKAFVMWGLINAVGLAGVNIYRYYLLKYKGAAWVKRYMADRRIQVVSTIITFEFIALSLTPVMRNVWRLAG